MAGTNIEETDRGVTNMDMRQRHELIRALSSYEHLSVGVNKGVFDIDTVDRMAGFYLIQMYENAEKVISHLRQGSRNDENINPDRYCEFEKLIIELKQRRSDGLHRREIKKIT